MTSRPAKPSAPAALSEGDSNQSPNRKAWAERTQSPALQALLEEDAGCFLHQSLSSPCLSALSKAEGCWLEDVDGRRYLDFHGNNVHHIGYGHPRLIEAVTRQMAELPFSPRRFTNEPAIALARKLGALAPDPLGKVLFATGGSDGIDMALKLARAATGRFKTISFWDSFHGAGFGGMSVGGESLFRSGPAGPLLPGTEHLPPFNCYRCPYGHGGAAGGRGTVDSEPAPDLEACQLTCARMVRYVLEKEGDVAAVVAEPVRATPYLPPPGFWLAVRQACDDHGTLLILDEIPNGLGKTGSLFTFEQFGVVPDMVVLGKGLGGGLLPISALIVRRDLDVLADRALGHYTHEKNPVTCRAALTTLEIIEAEKLADRAAALGAEALVRLRQMQARFPEQVGAVRGLGLLLGMELVTDCASRTPHPALADAVLYAALERGLSFKTTMGHMLTLTPPLVISREELMLGLDRLEAALETALAA